MLQVVVVDVQQHHQLPLQLIRVLLQEHVLLHLLELELELLHFHLAISCRI